MGWIDMPLKDRARYIQFAVQNGITNLDDIRTLYDEYETQKLSEIVESVNNRSNADFVNRLKDPNRKTIPDWQDPENSVATHKIATSRDRNGNIIVYPDVQNIDGELYDFTDPRNDRGKWDALDSAIERGDTLMMNPYEADIFSRRYKEKYDTFNKYDGNNPAGQFLRRVAPSLADVIFDSTIDTQDTQQEGILAKTVRELQEEKSSGRKRVRNNDTPTATGTYDTGDPWFYNSTVVEDYNNNHISENYSTDPLYWLPYDESKPIRVMNNRLSKNQLDSLAKYAGQAGVPKESLGLGFESAWGSVPLGNTISALDKTKEGSGIPEEKKALYDRVMMNANYNRAFGGIPADAFVRDAEYSGKASIVRRNNGPREGHPLLHAFDYFDRGLYNPGNKGHYPNTIKIGEQLFKDPEFLKWWKESGESFYNQARTAASKAALRSYDRLYNNRRKRKHPVSHSDGGFLNKKFI